ncbi:hypothetical protein D3Z39_08800 [Anaerotruncus colihominis]|uniref:Uncharacterized protein n=1 Tax=Anaerotruncus colihominis TaxID=169435 RepID=A0A845RHM0_9FIRM|nr:hypothetical protein [Anaerotruncus colihominis]
MGSLLFILHFHTTVRPPPPFAAQPVKVPEPAPLFAAQPTKVFCRGFFSKKPESFLPSFFFQKSGGACFFG